jgi:hypothetical protein
MGAEQSDGGNALLELFVVKIVLTDREKQYILFCEDYFKQGAIRWKTRLKKSFGIILTTKMTS